MGVAPRDSAAGRPGLGQRALVAVGLAIVAVALFVPFGENEAGCFDHCADARRYFVWHPFDNLGAVFLGVGIAGMIATCRGRLRTQPRRWLAALTGWFGVFLTLAVSPAVIQEMGLYGGPEFEPLAGGIVVSLGYAALFLAALPTLFGLRRAPSRPPTAPVSR